MEIYHNPKTVFPCPLEGAQNVLPTRAGQERFTIPYVDGPPRDGQPDPIESSACDFGEIYFSLCSQGRKGVEEGMCGVGKGVLHEMLQKSLTHDECIVVLLQLVKSAVCLVSCHECTDRPLIDRTGVFLVECRRDERFQHEPPSKIHTVVICVEMIPST